MRIVELVEKKDNYDKRESGTYAGYKYDKDDVKKLRQWAKDKGIPNRIPSNNIHTTLLYSKKKCPDYEPLGSLKNPIVAKLGKPEVWDDHNNGTKALVIKLDAPDMVKRHKELMKQHDATYDYPTYKPHISLSYDVGEDFDLDKLSDMQDNVKELKAVEEYGGDIND